MQIVRQHRRISMMVIAVVMIPDAVRILRPGCRRRRRSRCRWHRHRTIRVQRRAIPFATGRQMIVMIIVIDTATRAAAGGHRIGQLILALDGETVGRTDRHGRLVIVVVGTGPAHARECAGGGGRVVAATATAAVAVVRQWQLVVVVVMIVLVAGRQFGFDTCRRDQHGNMMGRRGSGSAVFRCGSQHLLLLLLLLYSNLVIGGGGQHLGGGGRCGSGLRRRR